MTETGFARSAPVFWCHTAWVELFNSEQIGGSCPFILIGMRKLEVTEMTGDGE